MLPLGKDLYPIELLALLLKQGPSGLENPEMLTKIEVPV